MTDNGVNSDVGARVREGGGSRIRGTTPGWGPGFFDERSRFEEVRGGENAKSNRVSAKEHKRSAVILKYSARRKRHQASLTTGKWEAALQNGK